MTAFTVALVLLLVSALTAHQASGAVIDAAAQVEAEQGHRLRLNHLLAAVVTVESTARGYAATGDEAFLALHPESMRQARLALTELHAVAAGDPQQAAEAGDLETLIEQRLALSEALVSERRRGGEAAALAYIATGTGLELMGRIRERVALEIAESEQSLAAARTKAVATARRSAVVATATVVTGLVVLALAFLLIRSMLKEARAAHAVSESMARILGASDEALIGKTLDGTVISWSSGAEDLYGYRMQEMVGNSIFRIIPPDLHDGLRALMARVARGERIAAFDTRRIRKDGTELGVSVALSPVLDAAGSVMAIATVARDLAKSRASERAQHDVIEGLRLALSQVSTLSGLIPTCAWCKAVRDEAGTWGSVESYLSAHAQVEFTHGICPGCESKLRSTGG